jgi:phasin
MADQGTQSFQIPNEMRAFAEQSVAQAKQAFDGFMNAAQGAVSTFEGRAVAAQAGARDVQRKAVACAEHNVSASFDFARKLLAAKDAGEMVKLHADYVQAQIRALGEQARELGETASKAATKVATDATKD